MWSVSRPAALAFHRVLLIHGGFPLEGRCRAPSPAPQPPKALSQTPLILGLCLCPTAAVASDHHLKVSKQHRFTLSSSASQKSRVGLTGLKSRFLQGCVPAGTSRGESASWPPPASKGAGVPWLMAPPPSVHVTLSLYHFTFSLLPSHKDPPGITWDPWGHSGESPHFKILNPIGSIPFAMCSGIDSVVVLQ